VSNLGQIKLMSQSRVLELVDMEGLACEGCRF
jgi:hypothetical protein